MHYAQDGAVRIAWYCDGPEGAPALFLCNSIGTDHRVWDPVMSLLTPHFRVIRMDTRGHGASSVGEGEYSLEQLAADMELVAQDAGLTRFEICGVSLGAMMAMQYALLYPERVRRLVLSNTSVQMDPQAWQLRIDTVRAQGMQAIVDMAMSRFFTPEYVAENSPAYARVRETFLGLSPQGYTACCAAIRDMNLSDRIEQIQVPTLVLTGARDMSTPHEAGAFIASRIPGAEIRQLGAGHIPASEIPDEFAQVLCDFLQD